MLGNTEDPIKFHGDEFKVRQVSLSYFFLLALSAAWGNAGEELGMTKPRERHGVRCLRQSNKVLFSWRREMKTWGWREGMRSVERKINGS